MASEPTAADVARKLMEMRDRAPGATVYIQEVINLIREMYKT